MSPACRAPGRGRRAPKAGAYQPQDPDSGHTVRGVTQSNTRLGVVTAG